MRKRIRVLLITATCLAVSAAQAADGLPVVEHSTPLPPPGNSLGTKPYQATAAEKGATKDWKPEDLESGSAEVESLRRKSGERVSWFGIVRAVKEENGQTNLNVEMKYFDGLTDIHQQIVSVNGAGDFVVHVPGTGHKIKPLGLVRMYGTVSGEQTGAPTVKAAYVRFWDWGLFAFMDYGKDHSNPKWTKLRKIDPDDVYSRAPDDSYYEQTLGKR